MRDDPHHTVFLPERFQGIESCLEGFFIQRTEAFVEEEKVLVGTALLLNAFSQRQVERQRSLKGLSARQGFYVPNFSVVEVIAYLKLILIRYLQAKLLAG